MIRTCINCGCEFETQISKKVSCSRRCSQTWRQKNVYKDRYTVVHRSSNPRNFLRALATKKLERRKLDIDFLMKLYEDQEGKCAISGKDMTYQSGKGRIPTNISIDRIDSNIGYEPSNIQTLCANCHRYKTGVQMGWILE